MPIKGVEIHAVVRNRGPVTSGFKHQACRGMIGMGRIAPPDRSPRGAVERERMELMREWRDDKERISGDLRRTDVALASRQLEGEAELKTRNVVGVDLIQCTEARSREELGSGCLGVGQLFAAERFS